MSQPTGPGPQGYPPYPPPPRQQPAWRRRLPLWIALGVVAIGVVSCIAAVASSGGGEPSASSTPIPAPTTATTSAPSTAVASTQPATQQPTEPPTSAAPVFVTVPNVVGRDLQSAQEELFPPLRSTSIDATGQNRAQLWDRNWIVVRQEPPAGTEVTVLTDVKLYVVKEGEAAR
ncbi:hypothetical protein I6A84_33850 [Frankia sp. CNm7]|uniref:PASTA domain-containing protein n=1 Tax=Frankia nepalensis TaxID=1836974 RepID=A0A937UQI8_9ACTN|nr:hypothetical protein [Frankia nepalensis]MBL7498320.1 hypothetical protein [Frankia nepalensis]MBL7512989.1 hypothetical protein [Frankia nepalensis]MBL7522939.1 hypothetical protein [Frankia nepalensis]MBL7630133.1 hypothetical protein [Frankia nepalensis]